MRIKPKSAHNDFKTGFFGKIFFLIGIILLFFYIIERVTLALGLSGYILGILIAFSILFLGIGLLIYFISCQFAKLSKIVDDVENENSSIYKEE